MLRNQRKLEDLPDELLGSCFQYLKDSRKQIQNLRLVSRRFNAVSSEFLIESYPVHIESESLYRFERLSQHPVFCKSIKNIKIIVSYYDASLAVDRGLFGMHCGSNLYQHVEIYERFIDSGEEGLDYSRLWLIPDEWEAVGNENFVEESSTERQRFLLAAHSEYHRRFIDQEQLKQDGAHIRRICAGLMRLCNLQYIAIDDDPHTRSYEGERKPFSDEELMESCLIQSTWKGSYITSSLTSPPVEFIPELFQALSVSSTIRPSKFTIRITPPNDLRCLQLTEIQRQAVRTVLGRSQHLTCKVSSWARKDSLAEDNTRPREEMLALGSLTSAFFDVANLTTLELSFDEYPVFYERPTVGLADLLPLTRPWPHLRNLSLRYTPCHLEELQILVDSLRNILTRFETYCLYLLSGSWLEALDVLRGFESLQYISFEFPKGANFGDGRRIHPTIPEERMARYVLKLSDRNPLHSLNQEGN